MPRPTSADMHIQTALGNVSIAYRNESYIADQVFPNVTVRKQADKYFIFDKAAWFRNEAGPRAPGTRAVEGGYSLSQGSYACEEVAFAKVVADEEEQNADDPLMPRRTAVEFATDKILLNHELAVARLVFDNGSWAASATPSTTWDDTASTPIEEIEIAKETVVLAIGREPNVCVMGRQVWTDLRTHPDLLDTFKYVERGLLSVAAFQNLFGFQKVLIGTAIYASANDMDAVAVGAGGAPAAATVTYSAVWDKNMWLGYVPNAPALGVPAAGYSFTWKPRSVAQFRREEEEATVYRVREHYDVAVTCSDAGYEFIDCVA